MTLNSILSMVISFSSHRKALGLFLILGLIVGAAAGSNFAGTVRASADDDVIMIVNGHSIMKDAFYTRLEQEQGKEVLDQLIMEALILQAGEEEGISPSDEDLEKNLEDFKTNFPDEATFQMVLSQHGMTEEQLRYEMQFLAILERLSTKDVEVTDEDIESFFQANKEELGQPYQIRASHILVEDEAQAQEIHQALVDGSDFSELAAEYSIDPGSKNQGGDLGFFGKGAMVPEFGDVAFALGVNGLSGIVETPYGYHIILVTESKDAVEATLEDNKDRIKELLTSQQAKDVNEILAGLRSNASIEVNWDKYEALAQ